MPRWAGDPDAPIPSGGAAGPAVGLEGHPRVDAGALEASLPSLVDAVIRGPVVLTRNGTDAFVLLPVDIWQRVWAAAPRPPVVEASVESPVDAPGEKAARRRGKA